MNWSYRSHVDADMMKRKLDPDHHWFDLHDGPEVLKRSAMTYADSLEKNKILKASGMEWVRVWP